MGIIIALALVEGKTYAILHKSALQSFNINK